MFNDCIVLLFDTSLISFVWIQARVSRKWARLWLLTFPVLRQSFFLEYSRSGADLVLNLAWQFPSYENWHKTFAFSWSTLSTMMSSFYRELCICDDRFLMIVSYYYLTRHWYCLYGYKLVSPENEPSYDFLHSLCYVKAFCWSSLGNVGASTVYANKFINWSILMLELKFVTMM